MDPNLVLLLGLFAVLFLMFNSSRKRRREQQAMQDRLRPGAEVMTSSGLFATVVDIEDTAVVLDIGDGLETRWARAAVARVVTDADDADDTDGADDADADDTAGYGADADGTSDDRVVEPRSGSDRDVVIDPAADPVDRRAGGAPPQPGRPER